MKKIVSSYESNGGDPIYYGYHSQITPTSAENIVVVQIDFALWEPS